MPPAVPWYVTFAQLFYAAPVLLVSVIGLMLSIRWVAYHPKRSRWAAAGFGVIFASRLVTATALELMSLFLDDAGWTPADYQKTAVFISVVNAVLMAAGVGLLGVAVFVQENATGPRSSVEREHPSSA